MTTFTIGIAGSQTPRKCSVADTCKGEHGISDTTLLGGNGEILVLVFYQIDLRLKSLLRLMITSTIK